MPAPRKVMLLDDGSYCEVIVFGDVEAHDKFIVQTWHRTAVIKDGKIARVFYGYTYPAFPPARQDPKAENFYRALLIFANYWDKQLRDFVAALLPDNEWVDMSKHAFAKELMVRPAGVYPKYGAVDRDYYGSEYDGFQDIFTSSVYTNLEWGRFETAKQIIDNYFTDFVGSPISTTSASSCRAIVRATDSFRDGANQTRVSLLNRQHGGSPTSPTAPLPREVYAMSPVRGRRFLRQRIG